MMLLQHGIHLLLLNHGFCLLLYVVAGDGVLLCDLSTDSRWRLLYVQSFIFELCADV